MAERRSTYLFYDEQDYNNLKDTVYDKTHRCITTVIKSIGTDLMGIMMDTTVHGE